MISRTSKGMFADHHESGDPEWDTLTKFINFLVKYKLKKLPLKGTNKPHH